MCWRPLVSMGAETGEDVLNFEIIDFNGAEKLFSGEAAQEWEDLQQVLSASPLFLQSSDQAGRQGTPIFDPKATNAYLTTEASRAGWTPGIPVPQELTMFGVDWDAGKRSILAEWQFSNYPFLWNNVIRSEAVVAGAVRLPDLEPVQGLVVVTKSGSIPASNSTLYYEQGRAQLDAVMNQFSAFDLPIRLVGLMLPKDVERLEAEWSVYPSRYSREPATTETVTMEVTWGGVAKYGNRSASFTQLSGSSEGWSEGTEPEL